MEEFWNKLLLQKITPNEFYLLYSLKENTEPPLVNVQLELRNLRNKQKWIDKENNLSDDALKLIEEVESFFVKQIKKTNQKKMGFNYTEEIKKYNSLWPAMRLPSGKAAKSAFGNLTPAFRWFFENYSYSWETIFKATALYLDEKEKDNWEYTRNSQYFIRKQAPDKSWNSDLADYCQLIEDGGSDKPFIFTENVF